MKQGTICKSSKLGEKELDKINQYTRRPVTEEEVYCFSLILCDNDIDRDGECFPEASLHALAPLFLGKTGLFDHETKSTGQTARIFDTEVVYDPLVQTKTGEPYAALKARAYLMRSEKTEPLILEIDGGIKKEVSVGCSVRRVTCSICGADLRHETCGHRIGESYDGALCYAKLEDPADAYEWSFVAVPAQPKAGVVKGFAVQRTLDEVKKTLLEDQAVTLQKSEARALLAHLEEQERLASEGVRYRALLQKQVQRFAAVSGSGVLPQMLQKAMARMNTEELESLANELEKQANTCPEGRQLPGTPKAMQAGQNESFKI